MHRRLLLFAVPSALLIAACGGSTEVVTTVTGQASTNTVVHTVTAARSTATSATNAGTSTDTASNAGVSGACTPQDLGIHYVQTLGAAGTSYATFEFINVSSSSCTLYGYPGVSLVLTSGTVDNVTNVRTPATPHTVTLGSGRGAGFVVGIPGNAAPHCVGAADFRFIPPNDTAYVQIAHATQVCGGHISVSPVGDTQG